MDLAQASTLVQSCKLSWRLMYTEDDAGGGTILHMQLLGIQQEQTQRRWVSKCFLQPLPDAVGMSVGH